MYDITYARLRALTLDLILFVSFDFNFELIFPSLFLHSQWYSFCSTVLENCPSSSCFSLFPQPATFLKGLFFIFYFFSTTCHVFKSFFFKVGGLNLSQRDLDRDLDLDAQKISVSTVEKISTVFKS